MADVRQPSRLPASGNGTAGDTRSTVGDLRIVPNHSQPQTQHSSPAQIGHTFRHHNALDDAEAARRVLAAIIKERGKAWGVG